MKNLERDAEDTFEKPLIAASDEDTEQFVTATAVKAEANNPGGIYTDLIADIKTKAALWRTHREKSGKGDQKEATADVRDVEGDIRKGAKDLFIAVQFKFGASNNKLKAFFPKGLTELYRAKQGDWTNILARLVSKTADNVAELGQPLLDTVTALQTDWETNKTSQNQEIGKVKGSTSDKKAIIKPLSQSLTALYLTVRLKNLNNPSAAVKVIFDESVFNSNTNPDNDGLGRPILLLTLADGTIVAGGKLAYTNQASGRTYKGKTNKTGIYRGPNQDEGQIEGTATLPDGSKSVTFTLPIFDDNDPVHTLVIE